MWKQFVLSTVSVAVMMACLLLQASASLAQDLPPQPSDEAVSSPQTAALPPAVARPHLDPSNAATWYRQAIAKYHAINRTITDDQWMAVYAFEGDPSRGPSVEVRQILRRLQPAIHLTLRAARQPVSDFAVDYSVDNQQFQHLGDVRQLIRLVGYDLQVRMFDHDVKAVTRHIGSMYRMADQVAQERAVIGSLVGSALVAFADRALGEAMDRAQIGPGEANAILQSMSRLDGPDPMRYRDAMAEQADTMLQPAMNRYSGEGGIDRFRADHADALRSRPELLSQASTLTQEEFDAALRRFAGFTRRMAEAFDDPDADSGLRAMRQVKADADSDAFGPLAELFIMFNGEKCLDMIALTNKQLTDRRETLVGIVEGRIDPMSLANAAVWYVRATLQVEGIDPDKLRTIDAYAARHDTPASAELSSILNRHDVQSVIETLRTASNMRRCDWQFAGGYWSALFQRYHAGLLACGRLLVADAARLVHQQRFDDAAQRLAIAYQLAAHVAPDRTIAGSMIAHRVFADADALAQAAIESGMFNTDQITALAERVRLLGRGDPFHFQASIGHLRRSLDHTMLYFVQGLPKSLPPASPEQRERADGILAALDADQFLSLATVCEHWTQAYYKQPGDFRSNCAGLDGIMDVQAMHACADFAPALTEWARRGEIEQVLVAKFPVIAPLQATAKQSISDYRRAVIRYERLAPREQRDAAEEQSTGG